MVLRIFTSVKYFLSDVTTCSQLLLWPLMWLSFGSIWAIGLYSYWINYNIIITFLVQPIFIENNANVWRKNHWEFLEFLQKHPFKCLLCVIFTNMGISPALQNKLVLSGNLILNMWARSMTQATDIYKHLHKYNLRLTTEKEEIAVPTHCYSALKWALAAQCSKHL